MSFRQAQAWYNADVVVGNEWLPSPLGSVVGDKYELEEVLGVGGMGVVIRARHVELNGRVAIKFVKRTVLSDHSASRRLLREAKAAAQLTSPYATRVFDVGQTTDETPFIVMEYLQGESFSQRLRTVGPYPVSLACELMAQVSSAIAEAHGHGMVHRDVTPNNLFHCQLPTGEAFAKVLDFGLAKSWSSQHGSDTTSHHLLLGSPPYMAPEQIRKSNHQDPRSDIWSLGVVTQQLVTGELPFSGRSPADCFASILSDLPAPLSRPVPAALAQLVAQCLRKNPLERPATATELAAAFRSLAAAPSLSDPVEFDAEETLTRTHPPSVQPWRK